MSNLKILFLVQRFSPALGGSEQLAEKYVDYLSQKHEVDVVTTDAIELDAFWNDSKKQNVSLPSKPYSVQRFSITTPDKIPENYFSQHFPISQPGPFSIDLWKFLNHPQKKYDLIIGTSFPYDHLIPSVFYSKINNIP